MIVHPDIIIWLSLNQIETSIYLKIFTQMNEGSLLLSGYILGPGPSNVLAGPHLDAQYWMSL